MSVNSRIEDHGNNHYIIAYNQCIELGKDRVLRIFEPNPENPGARKIEWIIRYHLGEDGLAEINAIMQKLREDQTLDRPDQIVLGMAYHECGEANALPKKGNEFIQEGHLLRKMALRNVKGSLPAEGVGAVPPTRRQPRPLIHGSSSLRECSLNL